MNVLCKALMTVPLAVGVLASCVPRSAAQMTVFDPSNDNPAQSITKSCQRPSPEDLR